MQNQIPNNWQKEDLENLLEMIIDRRGLTPIKLQGEWSPEGIPALSAKNIKTGKIINQHEIRFVNQQLYDKWMPQKLDKEDILLTSEAPLGELFLLREKKDYVLSQRLFALRTDKTKLSATYLYYYLQSQIGRHELLRRLSGTAAEGIRQAELRKIKIYFPVLEKQKEIASILSSLDEKIELNNKISKTLEEMANTIFKEWFIKFHFPGFEKTEFIDSELGKIPKGWKAIKLEEILKLKHGYAFKGNKFINEKTNNIVVRMGNFQENSGLQFLNNTVYLKNIDSQNKYLLNPGDIVMILSDITREGRLIGNVGIIPNDEKSYFLNQRVAKIETDKKYVLYLLNLFTSKEFHQHCLSRADSATVLNLKNEHIHDYEIALPEDNIFKKFDELIEPIINKKEHIKYENKKLAKMRDLLLPRLMKGEIRV